MPTKVPLEMASNTDDEPSGDEAENEACAEEEVQLNQDQRLYQMGAAQKVLIEVEKVKRSGFVGQLYSAELGEEETQPPSPGTLDELEKVIKERKLLSAEQLEAL